MTYEAGGRPVAITGTKLDTSLKRACLYRETQGTCVALFPGLLLQVLRQGSYVNAAKINNTGAYYEENKRRFLITTRGLNKT